MYKKLKVAFKARLLTSEVNKDFFFLIFRYSNSYYLKCGLKDDNNKVTWKIFLMHAHRNCISRKKNHFDNLSFLQEWQFNAGHVAYIYHQRPSPSVDDEYGVGWGQIIPGNECRVNFLKFVLQLKNPRKTSTRKFIRPGVELVPLHERQRRYR